ncbi:MAG: CDP-diacylglycerol--glycerol-3-phosphate 3-phosphatidyltransferase [Clostridia bacterium]|nr:CDP-diacylglycerol--glycerol-3-phosphate 3-phosphatidyltransferase [Clostridia bacterium]
MKLNLPNQLTLLRVVMIPLFMFFVIFPVFGELITPIVATAVFILTALTDMLDGKIARKYNLITNFGKFLDPLADKCMILGGFIALLCVASVRGEIYTYVLTWSFFLVLLRELAVTSMRLVVSDAGNIVIAANWMGKVKTVLQTVTMVVLILEPVLMTYVYNTNNIVSYVFLGLTVIITMWSGINYFAAYWPYLDPTK